MPPAPSSAASARTITTLHASAGVPVPPGTAFKHQNTNQHRCLHQAWRPRGSAPLLAPSAGEEDAPHPAGNPHPEGPGADPSRHHCGWAMLREPHGAGTGTSHGPTSTAAGGQPAQSEARAMESRGRERSRAQDDAEHQPGAPRCSPRPTRRHSLVQAAAVLPLLAQPGPAWLGFPGHVQI